LFSAPGLFGIVTSVSEPSSSMVIVIGMVIKRVVVGLFEGRTSGQHLERKIYILVWRIR